MEERIYKIEREYKENASWKDIYLDFIIYDLPESISAEPNDNYQTPFIALIDLNLIIHQNFCIMMERICRLWWKNNINIYN